MTTGSANSASKYPADAPCSPIGSGLEDLFSVSVLQAARQAAVASPGTPVDLACGFAIVDVALATEATALCRRYKAAWPARWTEPEGIDIDIGANTDPATMNAIGCTKD